MAILTLKRYKTMMKENAQTCETIKCLTNDTD